MAGAEAAAFLRLFTGERRGAHGKPSPESVAAARQQTGGGRGANGSSEDRRSEDSVGAVKGEDSIRDNGSQRNSQPCRREYGPSRPVQHLDLELEI